VFHHLKLSKYPFESKFSFLGLVAKIFEKDIELLALQIQFYSFQDPKNFLENIPSPKQDEILLPSDLQIDQIFFGIWD